jgi:predicted phosphodiesterase
LNYTKEDLFEIMEQYEEKYGCLPNRDEARGTGFPERPFVRIFGGLSKAKTEYHQRKLEKGNSMLGSDKIQTTLVIPDSHVGPDQDLSRFDKLNRLILEKKPDNIIFMGDFVTLESLSNWDLNKSGVMEGRRYQLDIECGRIALEKTLRDVKRTYNPNVIFLKGNHESRLDRYLETKAELKEHLNLDNDLKLKEFGIDEIIEFRDYYNIDGVDFTHAPMNAANQAVSGKYAIHRASEMTQNSLVFAHSHRKEYVNFYRHGSDDIVQVMMCGAFFEHTDSYAYGGLNAYWRGLVILKHWKCGRFDAEEICLERLMEEY